MERETLKTPPAGVRHETEPRVEALLSALDRAAHGERGVRVGALAAKSAGLPPTLGEALDRLLAELDRCTGAEARWRTDLLGAFHDADFALTVTTGEGRIEMANRACERLLRAAPGALAGRHVLDVTHPEDRAAVEKMLVEVHEPPTARRRFTHRIVRDDGTTGWIEISSGSIAGTPGRRIVMIHDVTASHEAEEELRASEAQYRHIFERIPLPVFVFDPVTLRILDANDLAAAKYGWTREEFATMSVLDIRPPEDAERLREAIASAPRRNAYYSAVRHRKRDGTLIEVDVLAHEFMSGGRPVRIALIHDISDRLREARELEEMRRTALRYEKLTAMGTLVGGVAHEVRTPLTYIGNNLALIERRLASGADPRSDEDLREALAEAREGIARIDKLVRELRQFAQQGASVRATIPLENPVLAAVRLFRATAGPDVGLVVDVSTRAAVEADAGQIQQIVLNLLQNAGDAIKAQGGRILLSTAQGADDARIVVEDDGPGIGPEIRAQMFDTLFTTKPDGTGLGLSIVRRIVTDHGGRIECESTPGRGTKFSVILPLAPAGKTGQGFSVGGGDPPA